jgi:hypothetical protein
MMGCHVWWCDCIIVSTEAEIPICFCKLGRSRGALLDPQKKKENIRAMMFFLFGLACMEIMIGERKGVSKKKSKPQQ